MGVVALNKEEIEEIIEKLRNGEIKQYEVTKEEFMEFREVLIKQKDKEQIRGEAKKGGGVVYTHVNE
ncbi:hypothetical protein BAZO_00245 [Schinkia azotoformans LMG 9581]|uniref:Uncharacterized protein n=1 Tax=Schinkia azotoformans LMG 9581 TaxID=1131731 RepID=K6DF84_SCHAZ|nr:hypothetical protein BAZO_00245 [Schinkia azotoformans LMG 9581]